MFYWIGYICFEIIIELFFFFYNILVMYLEWGELLNILGKFFLKIVILDCGVEMVRNNLILILFDMGFLEKCLVIKNIFFLEE